MRSLAPACCLLLLGALWAERAAAGSSFLSPEHHKGPKKEPKKLPAKLQPRALDDGQLGPAAQEGPEDELEIRFNAPFDVGIKLSGVQYHQHGQALSQFLQDVLWEANDVPEDK